MPKGLWGACTGALAGGAAPKLTERAKRGGSVFIVAWKGALLETLPAGCGICIGAAASSTNLANLNPNASCAGVGAADAWGLLPPAAPPRCRERLLWRPGCLRRVGHAIRCSTACMESGCAAGRGLDRKEMSGRTGWSAGSSAVSAPRSWPWLPMQGKRGDGPPGLQACPPFCAHKEGM